MKKIIVFALALFLTATAFANNQTGIDYYNAGQLKPARAFFEKQQSTASGASLSEVLYYLGEIAFDEGRVSDAASFFQKGTQANPTNLLTKIGEGMVLLNQKNVPAATAIFKAVIKEDKKNSDIYIAVANAFLKNEMTTEARENLELARKYNYKNPRLFMLEGDIATVENNIGAAASSYNQAFTLDPAYKEAYLKYARIYYTVNPDLSIQRLQELLATNPNYTIAYRELGEIQYYKGAFNSATESYKKYFAEGSSVYSIEDQARYANILFFNKEYDQSLAVVNDGLQYDTNYFSLNRLKMYDEFEMKNNEGALATANHFFTLGNDKNKFIALDYMYKGKLMQALNNDSVAIESFQQALAIDSTDVEAYKKIAEIYQKKGDFDNGVIFYQKFVTFSGDKLQNADRFLFGQYLYSAANSLDKNGEELTPELLAKKKEWLTLADSQFAIVQEKAPSSHLGTFWRGHVNSLLDPTSELGLAKPHYEMAATILESPESQAKPTPAKQKDLITSYQYLAYYYYTQKMFEDSKVFWNKILALDPANEAALAAQKLPGIK